jgi:hypothetical protein
MTPLATTTFLEVLFASAIVLPILILWVAAVVDVFRHGYSGVRVAAMLVLILILPILGPIAYFVIRGPDPGSADAAYRADAERRREAAHRPVGGTGLYR